jgi:muramidase (phage lysozyme)
MGGMNPFGGMDFSGGVPITGAGQDDTLIAAKTGEAILTEKDQQDIGQRYVDSTTGQPLSIPQYLSGRKPGSVSMGSLKFPGFGGGFFDGGVISKFNNGGIVGGIQNFIGGMGNLFKGERAKATQSPIRTPKPTKIPDYQLPEAKSLLKSIKTAEHYKGTKDPYNTLYGGGSAPITQMTVKEVIDMYTSRKIPKRLGGTSVKYGSGSGAAGAYQFMPFTLEDLIRRGEVKPHQMMTSDLQDKMGWALARNRGVSIQSLKKSGLSQSILDKIAPEWASLPYSGAGGASFYGQPVKGADSLRQTYQQSLPQKKKGGGLLTKLGGIGKVEESEKGSFNIPGATADRQLFSIMGGGTAALQPGEFVIPFDTVKHFGPSFFEKLVAMTDSNSDAYLKKGKIGGPQITPYKTFGSGSGGMITLPPITQSTGGSRARSAGLGGGSEVPDFSATAPNNERAMNASIYTYGLVV